jgi:hypothetical protein
LIWRSNSGLLYFSAPIKAALSPVWHI